MKLNITRLTMFTASLAALLLGASLAAQEPDEDDSENASPSAAALEQSQAGEAETATQEAANDSEDTARIATPSNASTEVFIPTEEVSVDKSISMPVDI